MDALSDSRLEDIVIMSSAQIGKTEILLNALGYFIDQDPSPILLLQPTLEMADAFSKDRLSPMIRDTKVLTGKVSDAKSRDSSNTIRHKRFPGGHVTMAGTNSPASLAMRPVRVVLADEVDRYPLSAGTEGDPITLARKRTANFPNRKIVLTSTPTTKGLSRIEAAWEQSDQRRFMVACPHCGERDYLRWENIRWDKAGEGEKLQHLPRTAHYVCPSCKGKITEADRAKMTATGIWESTDTGDGKTAGFHISALYSPWTPWAETVAAFLQAKSEGTESLKAWVNTYLGETWEDAGDSVADVPLLERREPYTMAPAGVLVITAGVDVQDDRLELEFVGWGHGEESWGLGYQTIYGDLSQDQIWKDLDSALSRIFDIQGGRKIKAACTCIDSGGHFTEQVYAYCRQRSGQRIYAIKGIAGEGRPLVGKPSPQRTGRIIRGTDLFTVAVDEAKGILYARLKLTEPGPGYCHFPLTPDYGIEYFSQLTAEKRITKKRFGFAYRVWEKMRDRNEALDCRVYAMAALYILNPAWDVLVNKRQGPQVQKDSSPRRKRGGYSPTKW